MCAIKGPREKILPHLFLSSQIRSKWKWKWFLLSPSEDCELKTATCEWIVFSISERGSRDDLIIYIDFFLSLMSLIVSTRVSPSESIMRGIEFHCSSLLSRCLVFPLATLIVLWWVSRQNNLHVIWNINKTMKNKLK